MRSAVYGGAVNGQTMLDDNDAMMLETTLAGVLRMSGSRFAGCAAAFGGSLVFSRVHPSVPQQRHSHVMELIL